MAKYTIELIRKMFEDEGYELVSNEYKNSRTKLQYICNKHRDKGIQEMSLSDFLNGKKCVYCRYELGLPYNRPWPDDIIADELDKLNCDFVERITVNNNSVIRFICRKHPWKGVQETNWTSIRMKMQICGVCSGSNRDTYDFKMMIQEINPDIEILGEYTGARNPIKVRCRIDGHIWEPLSYNLLSGYGCPICGIIKKGLSKRTSKEEKEKVLNEMHPDIEFLDIPERTTDLVTCKCKVCGNVWQATYSNLTHGENATGCPNCTMSKSEKMVKSLLESWGYNIDTQHKYDDCKDVFVLPFDFYLIDFNILIEFDGEQHFYPVRRHKNDPDGEKAKEQFDITTKHDDIKTQYCYDNNIPLIRIPYWHRDDLEHYLFDELVKYNAIEII